MWGSLLWGRDLLAEGLRWRVGNGRDINIYSDRWIPRPSEFKIISPPNLGSNATVDRLFSPTGGWNTDLINTSFFLDDARSILSISIASGSSPDSLFWNYEASGIYTVGSGYFLDRGLKVCPGNSNPSPIREWWKSFWKLHIPLKIKIFC